MRLNENDRYLAQFQEWGRGQPFVTDCAFRDDELEKAQTYVDAIVTTPKISVKAGRIFDCDANVDAGEDPIVYVAGVYELDLGQDLSRNNRTCQPGLFDTVDW